MSRSKQGRMVAVREILLTVRSERQTSVPVAANACQLTSKTLRGHS